MRPDIKSIGSPDLEEPRLPENPSNCQILIEAVIGTTDIDGGDLFSFLVITPAALGDVGLPRWGRGLMIVDSFSWDAVRRLLDRLLDHSAADDWHTIAMNLSKELDWEFENYRPYSP